MGDEFKPNDIRVLWWVRDNCNRWPSRTKLAYLMLYSHMGVDGGVWPSKATLAREMSMGKDAAIAALQDLEAIQLLADKQYRRRANGGQDSTWYRLRAPWQGDYIKRPDLAPLSVQQIGGLSDKQTGGIGPADRALSDQQTRAVGSADGACRVDRHEVFQEKETKEEHQPEAGAAECPAAPGLPPGLVETLQRQVGRRLVLTKVADLVRQYGPTRLRFAGLRTEEEQERRRAAGEDLITNPMSWFMKVLRDEPEEAAAAYLAERLARPEAGRTTTERKLPRGLQAMINAHEQAVAKENRSGDLRVDGALDPDQDPLADRIREQRQKFAASLEERPVRDEWRVGPAGNQVRVLTADDVE